MNFKQLDLLKNSLIDWNVNYSVYPYNGYTINEVLCQFFDAINKGIVVINDYTKWVDELLNWIKAEGLGDEVKQALDKMIQDGVFDRIINTNIFDELNNKVNANKDNIDAMGETLKFNSKFLENEIDVTNVKKYKLENCVGDGVTNNANKLQKIFDYAESNGITNIVFPRGKFLINGTVRFNHNILRKIYGKGATIISDNMDNIPVFKPKDVENGNMYNNMLSFEDLMLKGYGRENGDRNNGVCFEILCDGFGASRIGFKNVNVQDFKKGYLLGKGSYLINFNQIFTGHCGICYHIIDEGNCGENYNFHGGATYNSNIGFLIENEFTTVNLNGHSIDYCNDKLIHLKRGKLFATNYHIESNREFYEEPCLLMEHHEGNIMQLDDGIVLMIEGENKRLPRAIFGNNMQHKNSNFTISNSFLQGLKTSTGVICEGIGKINFSNCSKYEWDSFSPVLTYNNNLIFDGAINNVDLNYHPNIMLSNSNGRIESSYHTWDGAHCLKITKTSDNHDDDSKFLDIDMIGLIPHDANLLTGKFDVYANKRANIDVAIRGWITGLDGKKKPVDLYRAGNIILEPGVKTSIVPSGTQFPIKDKWFTHISYCISMYNCEQNTELYLKNIIMNTL